MAVVVITSAAVIGDNQMQVVGTVDGGSPVTLTLAADLVFGVGNAAAQQVYLAQQLKAAAAMSSSTTTDLAALPGTVTV